MLDKYLEHNTHNSEQRESWSIVHSPSPSSRLSMRSNPIQILVNLLDVVGG